MNLQSLIDLPGKLPTVPQVAQRVIASLGSEDVSSAEIAELISADPVLSAKLLQLANSSYFQMARTIETVEDALRVLGLGMVRNLVLAGGLVRAFSGTTGMDLRQFWRHNLFTACAARWLAGQSRVNADLAFTLGLMHGIGQLHMHQATPSAMVALDQQVHVLAHGRAALEKATLGFQYCEVSAALARLWNFPPSLAEALGQIPEPLATPAFSPVAGLVHLGAWHSSNFILATPPADNEASYPHDVGQRLGLARAWCQPPEATAQQRPQVARMPALPDLTHGLEQMLD
jgi:HD-like signal output (HDOD) protein